MLDGKSLVGHARASREVFCADLDALWSTLTALQRAAVARMVSAGDAFPPFDAASMAAYRDAVARSVETPEVQTALERLRAACVVVRPGRDRCYAADDASLPDWHAARFPAMIGASSPGDGRLP